MGFSTHVLQGPAGVPFCLSPWHGRKGPTCDHPGGPHFLLRAQACSDPRHKGNRQRTNGGWLPLDGGQPANTALLQFLSPGSPWMPLQGVRHGGRSGLFLTAHLKGEETGAQGGTRIPPSSRTVKPRDGRNHVPWTMRSLANEIRLPTHPKCDRERAGTKVRSLTHHR